MKKHILVISVLFITTLLTAQNTVLGKWKTVDDTSGKTMAVVEIFEKNQKFYGRVLEVLDPKAKGHVCSNCSGEDKNKPMPGLLIIKGLTKDGDEYSGGKILDPKSGKLYKCYITLEDKDKLKVRGYIGISILGRTQYWHRVK